jgi:type VI secretion system secreted protein VgrG
MATRPKSILSAITFGILALVQVPETANASTILGAADSFAILGGSAVVNTGTTTIAGNAGVYPGTAVTGGASLVLSGGAIHLADTAAQQAQADAAAAYNHLKGLTPTSNLTGQDLGGLSLTPGVYAYNSAAQLTGTLTLNEAGAPNQEFDFQIGSTLTTASNSSIIIINKNPTDSIFFQVGSSATLGANTVFVGNIIALASITLGDAAAIVDGRAFALNGSMGLNSNTITVPSPVPLPGTLPLFASAVLGVVRLGMVRSKAVRAA